MVEPFGGVRACGGLALCGAAWVKLKSYDFLVGFCNLWGRGIYRSG
jgi:hypothetical protein